MAKEDVPSVSKGLPGLKPIIILTVITILLMKGQRCATENVDSSEEIVTTDGLVTESPVCPDYCNLAPDRATRGKAPFRVWYFDVKEGSCKRFRWGGRGGNKNRFRKRADCEETCSKCTLSDIVELDGQTENNSSLNDTVCSQVMDEGRCSNPEAQSKQPQLVWHFNREKAKCRPFIFFGCGAGNLNRFSSKEECEEVCH